MMTRPTSNPSMIDGVSCARLLKRRRGQHAFTRAEFACFSALFAAGRHDEVIALIGGDPRRMWHDLLWIGRIKVSHSQVGEAIAVMGNAVNAWTPMVELARFA